MNLFGLHKTDFDGGFMKQGQVGLKILRANMSELEDLLDAIQMRLGNLPQISSCGF